MTSIKYVGFLLVLSATACSDGAGGSSGGGLTAEECRRYYEYTYSLDGMKASAILGEEILSKDSKTCSEAGSVTRRHFDCVMASKSVDALQACGAPNT